MNLANYKRRPAVFLSRLVFVVSCVWQLCISTAQSSPIDTTPLLDLGKQFCTDFSRTTEHELKSVITQTASNMLERDVTSDLSDIEMRGRRFGSRLALKINDGQVLEVQFISPPAQPPRTVLTSFDTLLRHTNNKPTTQLIIDSECYLSRSQTISYTSADTAEFIQPLVSNDSTTLVAAGAVDWINPALPVLPVIYPPRLRVAMVDSGVNYQLPEIANSLARDNTGKLIGFDYWDNDSTPYDANPARSPFSIQRHGTRTASIVISEAPGIALVPYRYPRPQMSRMKDLVEHAAANNVRIIGMPLGSNDYKSWTHFEKAAIKHPDILFIVSAGNNGRNIDINGVYPAAIDIPNMIVVTSADDFVLPAERTNYGPISVDYLVPAENIEAMDYNGQKIRVSGSSYAVSRVVALAARILNRDPQKSLQQLTNEIKTQSVRANTSKYVTTGYIGDPLASPAQITTSQINYQSLAVDSNSYLLPISINILSDAWQQDSILKATKTLNKIFAQCSIAVTIDQWQTVAVPDYLADLSTGHALTLHRKLGHQPLTVFFAADTIMQPQFDAEAFGEGNTSNRPWMRDTLWITYGIRDTGIALAHELFHIITNNGSHVTSNNNLMHQQTAENNTQLSIQQCSTAIKNGLATGLLIHQQ